MTRNRWEVSFLSTRNQYTLGEKTVDFIAYDLGALVDVVEERIADEGYTNIVITGIKLKGKVYEV